MTHEDDQPTRNRGATQADVARLAGVSQAIVSYVVTNSTSVSIPQETRERVLQAIETLGYVPHSAGRTLRTRKTFTVAGIIPDITNPFYPTFERGIQDVAQDHGYDLIACNTDGIVANELAYLRLAHEGRVDGLVGVFFHLTTIHLRPLLERGIAIVRLEPTRKPAGPLPLDNIYVDNTSAAHAATTYLIEHGHRRIAMLAGRSGPQQARVRGYRQALAEHGIPEDGTLIQGSGFREDDGYHDMRRILEREPRPTAVFAANDLIAMGALIALREAGLTVPDDMAIVGFDDIPAARLVSPPLTTVSQFAEQLGRRAAEMLFERLSGVVTGGGRSELMPHELIVRSSA
jgi:LacI family transcriptional regulator